MLMKEIRISRREAFLMAATTFSEVPSRVPAQPTYSEGLEICGSEKPTHVLVSDSLLVIPRANSYCVTITITALA